MTTELDRRAGFCGGVIRAVTKAEDCLSRLGKLYSLGAIVHNEEELTRLGRSGLSTIDAASMATLPEGTTVLVRAHGEPPSTYALARERGLNLIDCTCPVVLKLQKDILKAHGLGKIVIYGKIGHAEVLGLLGQVGGDALVTDSLAMLEGQISSGEIVPGERLEVFSQTTGSPNEYAKICDRLREISDKVNVHNTICAEVSGRHEQLRAFAAAHDVIIFVSGAASSNGKVLFDLCHGVNPRSYRISGADDIHPEWFLPGDTVGVSGATSTPKWLLEEVARNLQNMDFR